MPARPHWSPARRRDIRWTARRDAWPCPQASETWTEIEGSCKLSVCPRNSIQACRDAFLVLGIGHVEPATFTAKAPRSSRGAVNRSRYTSPRRNARDGSIGLFPILIRVRGQKKEGAVPCRLETNEFPNKSAFLHPLNTKSGLSRYPRRGDLKKLAEPAAERIP